VSLIERLALLGGMTGPVPPLVDVRLCDGARVVATLPPLAFRGPTLVYRKASREAWSLENLVEHGALSDGMARFFDYCIRYRKGLLLSVGPGVSASATLNALASIVTADERIVTIESGVELHLGHQNVSALVPGRGIGVDRLVQHAVSLQPDRVLIGPTTGEHLAAALRAMSGPLEGAILAYGAPTPEDALQRILDADLGPRARSADEARAVLGSAIAVVLQEQRFADGSRRVTRVSELVHDGEHLSLEDVFVFDSEGLDESGLVAGSFRATGYVPRFIEDLHERGLEVNLGLFEA
jgi:pilus assembly protein CpaF